MRRIVILGHLPAGIRVAEAVRANDPTAVIIVFSGEGELPYEGLCLPEILRKEGPGDGGVFRSAAALQKAGIEIRKDPVRRINFKRRRLITEDKEEIFFDDCLITDLGWLPPEGIKGSNRTGVILRNNPAQFRWARQELPYSETAIVEAEDLLSLRTVAALLAGGKEVKWVTKGPRPLAGFLDQETAEFLAGYLAGQGVEVITENPIREVLGDNEVKAIKLASGKVIAAQLVFLSALSADLRILSSTGIHISAAGLGVDPAGATNEPGVFALGPLAEDPPHNRYQDFDSYPQWLERQADVIAARLTGGEPPAAAPGDWLAQLDLRLGEDVLTLLGDPYPRAADDAQTFVDPDRRIFKKIFLQQGLPMGAVLFNASADRSLVAGLLQAQQPIGSGILRDLGFLPPRAGLDGVDMDRALAGSTMGPSAADQGGAHVSS